MHWLSKVFWTICRFVWSSVVYFILIHENFKLVLIFTYAITLESHWLGRREKSIHYAPLLWLFRRRIQGQALRNRSQKSQIDILKKLSLSTQNNRVPLHSTCLTKKRVWSKTSVTWIESVCCKIKYLRK